MINALHNLCNSITYSPVAKGAITAVGRSVSGPLVAVEKLARNSPERA